MPKIAKQTMAKLAERRRELSDELARAERAYAQIAGQLAAQASGAADTHSTAYDLAAAHCAVDICTARWDGFELALRELGITAALLLEH